jgi:hypothetical protein
MFVVASVLLLVGRAATPVHADNPNDGRINRIPWVNSHGAIAVYCVDQFDRPGASFTGGGIKILSEFGQKLFFAKESIINPARIQANETGKSVLILSSGLFSLYALPGGYFLLNTTPDKEGKTFLGKWKDCIPVGPAPAAPVCVPIPEDLTSCTLLIDNDCDGEVGFSTETETGFFPGDSDCDALFWLIQ